MSKLAVVTGATGGIGNALCARLWTENYRIIACGRDTLWLNVLQTRYAAYPAVIDFDATLTPKAILEALDPMLKLHQYCVDLLVVAHGASPVVRPSLMVQVDEFWRVWQIDVLGSFVMAQALAPSMLAQHRGSVVFVSSLHARHTYPARVPYASAKAGVVAMAKSLALEWGPQGVRVNCVLPWQVTGARSQAFINAATREGDDLLEAYKQRSPLRRLITPHEVAEAVMFLVKNEAMNGAEIVLDGGVSASMHYKPFLDAETPQPNKTEHSET